MLRKRYSRPGTAPATLTPLQPAQAGQRPVLHYMEYDEDQFVEREIAAVSDLPKRISENSKRWIELNGLSDVEMLKSLGERFGLHPLALEDVLNIGQRPKVEAYEDHIFIIVQMFYLRDDGALQCEQVSMFLLKDTLITIQEDPEMDVFTPVRERFRSGRAFIRKSGPDYLAYALIDAVIDHCFPVLEKLGDAIEDLEEEILENPTPASMHQVHEYRRTLIVLRRFVWPERDVVNSLLHDESGLIQKSTPVYLRDCYDHAVQIIDLIENYRDVTGGLLEMYLSSVSQRTSEVMRVLTVISAIFIPLTFVAGVYGMNFAYMPELEWPGGYFGCLAVMAAIAVTQIVIFKRKNWL